VKNGCKGLHCDGCHSHGRGELGAVIALLALIGLAALREAPKIVHVLEIIGYTVAAVSGTVIAGTCAFFITRVIVRHRRRAAARVAQHRDMSAVIVRLSPPSLDRSAGTRAIESARPAARWLKGTDRAAIGKPRRQP
jgi:hypothetical protein